MRATTGVLVAALALFAILSIREYRSGDAARWSSLAAAAYWLSNGVARPLFIPVR